MLNLKRIFGFLAVLFGAALALHFFAPNQHVPWRPLDPEAPLGLATGTQLTVLAVGPRSWCQSALEKTDLLNYAPAESKRNAQGCGWDTGLDIIWSKDVSLKGEATMQCPLAVGTHVWLQQVDRHAREELGSPLKRIHHYGTYSCRRINGASSGSWSEHAFANAWDVAGFELEDGRLITLLKHWDGGGAEAEFLRKSQRSACRLFRVTLGPDYNSAHADHFHIDMGPSFSCR